MAGLVVAFAAQGYPLVIAIATAVAVPVSAVFLARHPGRSWATWAAAGLGAGAVAVAALLPLTGFVQLDVYVLAAGVVAAGVAVGAGVVFATSSSDDEDDEGDRQPEDRSRTDEDS